ncbi:MAG: hypothetical protein FJY97_01720 [candidate division Zixibacteria bacterium]|nr:hypothetical protein [candidate division Zixibacteria bacterium]
MVRTTGRWVGAFIALFCLSGSGSAQEATPPRSLRSFTPFSLLSPAKTKTFGWMDPARFSMSHGYTMAFQSGSQGGNLRGLYTNTLSYRMSASAQLRVQVGIERFLLGTSPGAKPSGGTTRVLPGFEFLYRPSEKLSIYVGYSVSQPHGWGRSYPHAASPWEQDDASVPASLNFRD